MMRMELEKVRAWAKEKIAAGQEPPWAWYQYMKLIETCDAIIAGMDTTVTYGDAKLKIAVDNTDGIPVQMPM